MKSAAVSTVTPPLGTSGMSGNGPRHSRTNAGPTTDAGKTLTAAAPARHAASTSLGVAAPGSVGIPRAAAQATSSGSVCGMTRNVAPASRACCAASIERTVPAPIASSGDSTSDRFDRAQGGIHRVVEGDLESQHAAGEEGIRDLGALSAVSRLAMATTPPVRRPSGMAGLDVGSVTRFLRPLAWLPRDGWT